MMMNVSISEEWFEEIKDLVNHQNVEHITAGGFIGQVEVDVEEEAFYKVSKKLGWMV
jgi:hypothetical protein